VGFDRPADRAGQIADFRPAEARRRVGRAGERGYAAASGPVDHLDDRLHRTRPGGSQRLFPRTASRDDPRRAHLGDLPPERVAHRRLRQSLFVAAAEGHRFLCAGQLRAGHFDAPGFARAYPAVESDLHALDPSTRRPRRPVVQGAIGREAAGARPRRAHGRARRPPTCDRAGEPGIALAARGVAAGGQLRFLQQALSPLPAAFRHVPHQSRRALHAHVLEGDGAGSVPADDLARRSSGLRRRDRIWTSC
jgi:hypothetical protein